MAAKKKTATDNKKTVTIDDVQYDFDSLSPGVKAMLNNIRVVDSEITHLQTCLGIAQTARGAYAAALKSELDKQLTDTDVS
ncbi:MAG: DUF6447 family protein [Geobacteraceae bacterium]